MNRIISTLTAVVFGLCVALAARADMIVDNWDFNYANGTGVGSALSIQGADWGADNGVNAVVQNQQLVFAYDGSIASTFRNATPSQFAGATTGKYELSWTFTDVDFSQTHATSSTNLGRVGFGLRSTVSGNDDANVRLIGINDTLVLDYVDQDAANQVVLTVPGSQATNLSIRLVYDLDTKGTAGSFQGYYSLDGGVENPLFTDGVLYSDFRVDAIRMIQQTSNGSTSWIPGDTVAVDDILFTQVPEPSVMVFLGMGAAMLYMRRRNAVR